MKLDRNITTPRRGKYALIKLRGLNLPFPDCYYSGPQPQSDSIVPKAAIDYGDTDDSDFFVIRLKDKYAGAALAAYANAAMQDDPEYGREMMALAQKAIEHPSKRRPD